MTLPTERDKTMAAEEMAEGHVRCLVKSINRVRRLLLKDPALQDYDQIHSAKSILYAAIEQMGMRAERLCVVQRLLRELLFVVTSQCEPSQHDRSDGLQILEELESHLKLFQRSVS